MENQDAYLYIKQEMERQFPGKVTLLKEESAWDHHGWFRLWFTYKPKEYWIFFEGEFRSFNIRILASGKRYLPFRWIRNYDNILEEEAIQDAICQLKECLKEDLPFRQLRS